MKERAIIYLMGIITGMLLGAVLVSFTAEDKIESLSAINIANIIEEKEAEGYVVDHLKMREPNGIDCVFYCNECGNHIVIKQPFITVEPNSASYKEFFGWE